MSRIRTALVAALTFGRASAASAATITVDTDKATYLTGETITVTTTVILSDDEPFTIQALLELIWSDPQIAGTPGPAVQLTAITSGFFTWSVGAGNCLPTSCLVLDQLTPVGPIGGIPDPAVLISTLTMVADAIGLINFSFGTAFTFDATPIFGPNAAAASVVVPEPGTAALLGLGLSGLALADRRRCSRSRRLRCGSPVFEDCQR